MKYFFSLLFMLNFVTDLKAQTIGIQPIARDSASSVYFSGTYVINKSKINFGKAPATVLPVAFNVIRTGDTVIVSRMQIAAPGGQSILTDTLSSTKDSKTKAGMFDYISTLSWNKANQFTINRDVFIDKDKLYGKVTEVWSLEDNGKTLVLDKSVQGGVPYSIKGYYDQQ